MRTMQTACRKKPNYTTTGIDVLNLRELPSAGSSSSAGSSGSGLSSGAKVGIGVGVGVGVGGALVVALLAAWFFINRKRKNAQDTATGTTTITEQQAFMPPISELEQQKQQHHDITHELPVMADSPAEVQGSEKLKQGTMGTQRSELPWIRETQERRRYKTALLY